MEKKEKKKNPTSTNMQFLPIPIALNIVIYFNKQQYFGK